MDNRRAGHRYGSLCKTALQDQHYGKDRALDKTVDRFGGRIDLLTTQTENFWRASAVRTPWVEGLGMAALEV